MCFEKLVFQLGFQLVIFASLYIRYWSCIRNSSWTWQASQDWSAIPVSWHLWLRTQYDKICKIHSWLRQLTADKLNTKFVPFLVFTFAPKSRRPSADFGRTLPCIDSRGNTVLSANLIRCCSAQLALHSCAAVKRFSSSVDRGACVSVFGARENMLKMLACRGTAAGLWRLTSNISAWSDVRAAHKMRDRKVV